MLTPKQVVDRMRRKSLENKTSPQERLKRQRKNQPTTVDNSIYR